MLLEGLDGFAMFVIASDPCKVGPNESVLEVFLASEATIQIYHAIIAGRL